MYVCLNRGTVGAGMPLEDFVKLAADAGFAGADVDLAWGRDKGTAALRDLFHSRNMRFGGWGPPDWRGSAGAAAALEEFGKQAAIAKELGIDSCSTYILPSGDLPLLENWNFHVTRLRPIAQGLADHGLRLGLEFVSPHHLRRQWKHEFIFTMGQTLELAAAIAPNVGLLVDSFHVYAAGDTYEHLAKISQSQIVLVHLNDCPAGPIAQVQDFSRSLPGEGVIDLIGFLGAALAQTGYDGPISLEVFNQDLRAMTPVSAAKVAGDATNKLLSAARLK